jgi:type I restriction enzyme S subunit
MKPSGINWIGGIPVEWKINRIGFLFFFGKGLSITKEDLQDAGIPCVSYGEIHSKYGFEVNPDKNNLRCVDEKYLRTDRKSLLKYGDFLFADTSEDLEGSGNFTYLNSNEKVFAGYHTIILRARENVNHRYIAYMFDSISFRTQIRTNVWGIKVYSITQPILKNAKIILPSPKEQQAIAVFLDAQCNRIDNIITEMERQIEILKQYKTSLITETITKGLDKSASMKDSGIDWIGKIPTHWEMGRVKDLMFLQRGYDLAQDNFIEGNIPVYGSNGIVGYHNKKTTKGPNITIGRSGSIGEVNYIETDCWVHNTAIYIDDMKKNTCRYLYYVLLNIDIKSLGNGSAVPTLDRKNVQNVKIVFTRNITDQKMIASYLDAKLDKIDNIIAEKRQSLDTMRAYKKSLIYEYVTGKKRVKGYS